MTLRILYAASNFSVLQWQDTELYDYAEPATGMALLEVTQAQWDNQNVQMWVVDGQLTTDEPVFAIPPPDFLTSVELADKLDATVARVYSTWTRFEAEYEFREKAAIAYKAANYSGVCSVWITAFAGPAELTTRVACDLILAQAEGLRAAQEALGALRMRKYEILPLSEQAALDKYNEIDAAIQQVLATIS